MAKKAPPSSAVTAARPEGGNPAHIDLAAAIHETTNALTVISGWIERARATCDSSNIEAQRALQRAARYTRLARSDMRRAIGAQVPEQPPERLEGLIARALEDLQLQADGRGVGLETHIDDGTHNVSVPSPNTIWRILTNLLLNGIAASPENSTISVSASSSESTLTVRVWDQGSGIPEAKVATLFSAGRSHRPGGAGIGLRHAHALAAEHGGQLRLDEVNRGACFTLEWPVSEDPPSDISRRPAPSRTGLEGAQVLLLEDDAAVVELLELTLGARGATVIPVSSSVALEAELLSSTYDLVLVDLSPLSGADPSAGKRRDGGLDKVVRVARSSNPNISIIVISGSVTVVPRPDIIWVRKPFEPRELIAAMILARDPSRSP